MTTERAGISTFGGNPVTLLGPEIRLGDQAPEFEVLGTDLKPITLGSLGPKTRVLLSILSVDTNVCAAGMKELSRRTDEAPEKAILVVSADLPMNMKRWAESAGVENILMGSDHRTVSFGTAFGTLVKDQRVLSRAAFVVNPAGSVTYAEYVPEVGEQPDFEAILDAAREASRTPA